VQPLFHLYPADKSQPDCRCSPLSLLKSMSELLLPESIKGLKALLSIATHRTTSRYMALCVRVEPSLAQGAGHRLDERRDGLCM
jgi:hypothetical protein